MKRTTFDERNDQVPHAGSNLDGYLPCSFCRLATLKATLSQYGGRCRACFEDFCAAAFAPQPARYDTVQQAEMRKRLKTWSPAPNVLAKSDAEVDEKARDAAKAAAERRVREFAAARGISLELGDVHHSRAPDGSVTRARSEDRA